MAELRERHGAGIIPPDSRKGDPMTSLLFSAEAQAEPQVGDLATVALFNDKVSGARITRIHAETGYSTDYFVKLIGLSVPQPYRIGDSLVLSRSQLLAWGQE